MGEGRTWSCLEEGRSNAGMREGRGNLWGVRGGVTCK